jgi:biotin carboxyl carrier protein
MSEIKKPFQVKVGEFSFSFNEAELNAADLVQKSPTEFNLLYNNRSVNARLVEADGTGKLLKIEVEGETFTLEIRDELDQMLDQMGFNAVSTKRIKEIKAPMPGMVLSVAVTDGQEVKEGDRIVILEAMKMENSILIHADGKIKRVAVRAGQAVDKGQVLVELE